MTFRVTFTNKFKRDFKLIERRGKNLSKLQFVVDQLAEGASLPIKYRDHALTGQYANYRECHIEPDWLLVYQKFDDVLILLLSRTGTHSDIF